jgi:hypothetical protein
MSIHTDLFLRYVLPTMYLERHSLEVEHLRALAMEQDAKAVAYTWAACMASDLSECLREIHAPSLVIAGLHDLFTPPYLGASGGRRDLQGGIGSMGRARAFPIFRGSHAL